MAEQPRPLRVAAFTSTNTDKHQTWRLRVECLTPHLRQAGVEVDMVRLPRNQLAVYDALDRLRGYDVAWIHRLIFWPSGLRRLRPVAGRLVLDIDDPVNYSSSRPFNFSPGRCLRFRATVRACAAVLAASDGLADLARQQGAPAYLIPLCPEPARYSMRASPRAASEPFRLLWMGSPSTFKYLEGIRQHLEQIGKQCAGVELIVVGHTTLSLRHLPVRNVRWNPEAERIELDRCHVGLVPLARDRWTAAKAALKPLQYLASGLPFIGSPVGVNVHLADAGRNGLLAQAPADWVKAVRQLRDDERLRHGMGSRGVEYIHRHHRPEVLAARVADVFREVCGQTSLANAA